MPNYITILYSFDFFSTVQLNAYIRKTYFPTEK